MNGMTACQRAAKEASQESAKLDMSAIVGGAVELALSAAVAAFNVAAVASNGDQTKRRMSQDLVCEQYGVYNQCH